MNTKVLRRLRDIFSTYDLTEDARRSYIRQWVRSVRLLGDNWLLVKNVQRGQ
jgi:hypothetical protein